jgi:bla regulator protein blaR1
MRRTTGQVALAWSCAAIAVGWLSAAGRAQAPAFDVASIKENSSGSLDGVFRRQPGRFTVTNLSLEWIIQTAYGIREYQLVNAPSSARRRYDIAATFTPLDASQDEVRLMLQSLLADRFGLRVRREQRPLTIYELTQSSPGVFGPRLKSSPQDDCAALPLAVPQCRRFMTSFFIKGLWSMTQLARSLEQVMGAPVVDRSNMTGVFEIDLEWGTGNIGGAISTIGVDEQAALLTAIREQLGLRLNTTRAPYEVIVVDVVSAPTPN